jgi:RNA polymerase sigma-70 factor (ECF subfamily)
LQRHERAAERQDFDARQIDSRSAEADERERAERIAATLDMLPERQEAVLRAKYLDEHSVAEIAAAWKETPKAIESLLTRARQAFREQFERLAEKVD